MNINVNIGEILTKAWKIVWKFKVLWIFGIMAGCTGGNRSNFNNSYNNNTGGTGGGNNGGDIPEPFRQFADHPQEAINSFLSQYLAIIAVVLCLICVLWIVIYFIGTMGKTGLIKGASKADAGAEKLTFGEIWTESLPYFWRMLGLSFLVELPFLIVILTLVAIFFVALLGMLGKGSTDTTSIAGLLAALGIFVPAICCIAIVRIVVDMVVEQARNAIVIEELRVFEALRKGWNVFKTNFLTIIVMVIILGILGTVVGLIIIIPLLVILVPTFISVIAMSQGSSEIAMVPLIFGGLCCLAYFPVLLVLGGIQEAYTQSVWTLTYRRLTAPAPAVPANPETADAA